MNRRNASQQQPVAGNAQIQKPETAKEMYSRESAQEKANAKALGQMPPDQRAKVDRIKAALEKATQHIDRSATVPSPAPADNAGSPAAVRQNMTGQDKTAPALSPTNTETGKTVTDKRAVAPSNTPAAKTHDRPPSRPSQTIPRRPPSWER
jgi:hypothetical protein